MSALRVCADTSVFGGIHDDECRQPSVAFFDQVRSGHFRLVTSAVVQAEMVAAPVAVSRFFAAYDDAPDQVSECDTDRRVSVL